MAVQQPGSFWSPAAASSVLFAWFVVFIEDGIENDTQVVGAVLAGTASAILGGLALDRLAHRRKR